LKKSVVCLHGSVHSLTAAAEANRQQLTKLQNELAADGEKRRQTAETVKRLSRKLLLASKVPQLPYLENCLSFCYLLQQLLLLFMCFVLPV